MTGFRINLKKKWLGSTVPKWVSARDVKAVVRHCFPFTDVTDYFLITG